MQESPLELSFQVVATRRVKKRRRVTQTVLNNDTSEVAVGSSSPPKLPPPQPPSEADDIREPPEKIAKMEKGNEEACADENTTGSEQDRCSGDVSRAVHPHLTPLSPEDHHGRPPTPPETPESHQHINMHNISMEETKCEDLSADENNADEDCNSMDMDSNAITPSDDVPDDDEATMADQDSEAPLEVDTSHETEPELEIEIETDDGAVKESEQHSLTESPSESCNEQHDIIEVDEPSFDATDVESSGEHNFQNESDNEELGDVKPIRRVRRNVEIQAGQNSSCAFSDTDGEEATDESGALDLSDHARSVREARARSGIDLSRGQGTQTMLSITQSKTSKRKNKGSNGNTNNTTANVQTSVGQGSLSWPPSNQTHAATFHDLLTLSQAAVLQIALVQARAQEEAQKSMNSSKIGAKLNDAQDTLSFINGSGDTLTISAINTNNINSSITDSDSSCDNVSRTTHAKTVNGTVGSKVLRSVSMDSSSAEQRATTNTITISRAGKHGTLKSKLNKSPIHKSSAPGNNTLKIPTLANHTSKSPDGRSKSVEKETGSDRTGDPIFKITNQKLSECFRQQMNSKLKQNSTKVTLNKQTLSPTVSPTSTMDKSLTSSTNINTTLTYNIKPSVQNPASKQAQLKEPKHPQITFSKSIHSHVSTQPTSKDTQPTSKDSTPPSSKSAQPAFSCLEKTQLSPVSKVSQSDVLMPLVRANSRPAQQKSMLCRPSIQNSFSKPIQSPVSKPTTLCLLSKASSNGSYPTSNSISSSQSKLTSSYSESSSTKSSPSTLTSLTSSSSDVPRLRVTPPSKINAKLAASSCNGGTKSSSPSIVPSSTQPSSLSLSPKYSSSGPSIQTLSKNFNCSNGKTSAPVTITPISSASPANISKPAQLNIPRSTLSNGNGLLHTTTKNILNGNNLYKSLSSYNQNSIFSCNNILTNSFNSKTGLSSCNNALSSQNTISFTPLRTPNLSSASINNGRALSSLLSSSNSSMSLSNSIINSISNSMNTCMPLRTNTTNSAPVRATNSSVRQIPNPSLLHQQSESRLNGGASSGVTSLAGARLGSVLNRLGTGSNSSAGISRIESLTRTLHEKAAGAAAAAINTAAR